MKQKRCRHSHSWLICGGRLEPIATFEFGSNCDSHGMEKREAAVAWREYQDLFEVVKEKL